jgi:signal transduction histidine kinase
MWPPGNAVRQPAAGAAGGIPGGPAMTAVWSVAVRIARTVRCIAIAYIVVQVLIWHAFYAADPWRLAGPAAAVGWGAAIVIYLRRRWPSWQLAGLDAGFYIVLALSAGWCVPPAMRGDAANWLFIAMQSQLMVPAWFAFLALSAPLAVGMGVAYWAGVMIFPPPGSGGNFPVAPAALLVAIAAAHRCGRRMLYRRAARADVALARADSDARAQYVVLSRNIERRENGRLLHDTVLNTLTALARASSSDAAEVVGRCQHDVRLMEYVLSVRGDPALEAGRAYGGMIAAIEATAVEMRARGLDVHVQAGDASPGQHSPGQHSPGQHSPASTASPVVPVPVAVAIVRAVREALANVISHAGTAEAWVDICPVAPGGDVAVTGGIRVTVRDAGAGFDPARVDPARLGLRSSITERIADWGGLASIRSAPGEGTVVSLCWPGPVPAGLAPPGLAPAGLAPPGMVPAELTSPGPDADPDAMPAAGERPAQRAGLPW